MMNFKPGMEYYYGLGKMEQKKAINNVRSMRSCTLVEEFAGNDIRYRFNTFKYNNFW